MARVGLGGSGTGIGLGARVAGTLGHDAVDAYIAHMSGVKKAVHGEGREIQSRAEGAFAAHDNPGGHSIEGRRQDTDYIVSLTGPAPLSVEYGHGAYSQTRTITNSDGSTRQITFTVGASQGLHIMRKAAGL